MGLDGHAWQAAGSDEQTCLTRERRCCISRPMLHLEWWLGAVQAGARVGRVLLMCSSVHPRASSAPGQGLPSPQPAVLAASPKWARVYLRVFRNLELL